MVPKPLYEAGLMKKCKWEEKSFTSCVPVDSHYIFLLHKYICWRVANADKGGIELLFKLKYWMYWVFFTCHCNDGISKVKSSL